MLQVITDPITGRSKGYGFVRFGNEGERDRSLNEMMGHYIASRPIRVSLATAKKNPGGLQARLFFGFSACVQAFHQSVGLMKGSLARRWCTRVSMASRPRGCSSVHVLQE